MSSWLLDVKLPPLPEEVVRGKALYLKGFNGKLSLPLSPEDSHDYRAYEEYTSKDRPIIPLRFAEDEDFRFLKVGFYRIGANSYQSMIDGILREEALPKPDPVIIKGKLDGLKKRTKQPIDRNWQQSPMRADDVDLVHWLNNGSGYGILAGQGQDHKVILFDLDYLKECVELGVMDGMPESAVSMAREDAAHVFYKMTASDYEVLVSNATDDEKRLGKITFYDPKNPDRQIGEVKLGGSQCVGPGSCHWKGGRYALVHDVPVAIVPLAVIRPIIEKFRKKGDSRERETAPKPGSSSPLSSSSKGKGKVKGKKGWTDKIRIEKVLMPDKATDEGYGEHKGAHPLHGSEGGANLSINFDKNVWYCHRHKTGGGPLQAIAVAEGLIECQDVGKGCLNGIYAKVIDLCITKYGLSPEDIPYISYAGKAPDIKRSRLSYIMDIVEELCPFKVLTDDTIVLYDEATGAYQYNQENPAQGEQAILAFCSHLGNNFIDNNFAREILGVILRRDRVHINEFDNEVGRVLTKTGILDIKTGELSPFTPDFLSLNPCNIEWQGFGADTSEADTYMEWCHPGDEETQDYLWRRYGSIWAGVKGDQTLDIEYSPGTLAGKSTWMGIRKLIIGEQTSWLAPVDIICTSKTGRSGNLQFSAAFMEHKKCVDFAEPPEEAILNDQGVKQVTGEVMNARPPHGRRERPVVHDGGSILAANPQLRAAGGVSASVKRRLRYTLWDARVKEEDVINNYEEVLIAKGGPGFLVRFAEGYQRYLVDKLKPSPNMVKWLDEFIGQNDPLMGFAQAMLSPGTREDSILFEEIFRAWELYYDASGFAGTDKGKSFRIQPKSFGKTLQRQLKEMKWPYHAERDKAHQNTYYYGLKFTDDYWNLMAEDQVMVNEVNKSFNMVEASANR